MAARARDHRLASRGARDLAPRRAHQGEAPGGGHGPRGDSSRPGKTTVTERGVMHEWFGGCPGRAAHASSFFSPARLARGTRSSFFSAPRRVSVHPSSFFSARTVDPGLPVEFFLAFEPLTDPL